MKQFFFSVSVIWPKGLCVKLKARWSAGSGRKNVPEREHRAQLAGGEFGLSVA